MKIVGAKPIELRFRLALGATARGRQFPTYVFARAENGSMLSDMATAVIRPDPDAVFACAEISGLVFDDRNRDGYVQQGEPGIGGIGIDGTSGLRVTTDADGRFLITCPMLPAARIGEAIALVIDEATLPPGYRMTTTGTRQLDLPRGAILRPTFGAASLRVVTHILDPDSFETGSTRLKPDALAGLASLIDLLDRELSMLRLTYVGGDDDPLAQKRIAAARDLVSRAWAAKQRSYALSIETMSAGQSR